MSNGEPPGEQEYQYGFWIIIVCFFVVSVVFIISVYKWSEAKDVKLPEEFIVQARQESDAVYTLRDFVIDESRFRLRRRGREHASRMMVCCVSRRGFDNSGKQAAICRNVPVNQGQFVWLAASGTGDTGATFPAKKSENTPT